MPNCTHTGLPQSMCAHCNVSKFNSDNGISQIRQVKGPTSRFKSNTHGLDSKPVMFKRDSPLIAKLLGRVLGPRTKLKEGEVICSFCHTPTPKMTATEGVIDIKKIGKTQVLSEDTFRDDIAHIPVDAIACPNCCNRIQPLLDRDGNVKHPGTKQRPLGD